MLNKRPIQEQVLIILSLVIAAILIPLGVYRIVRADWLIAAFDISVSLFLIALSFNVYTNRHIELARKAFSIFVVFCALTTVYIEGKTQFIWLYPAIPLIFYLTQPFVAAKLTCFCIVLMTWMMQNEMTTFELITMTSSYILTGACSFAFGYQWHKYQQELLEMVVTDPLTKAKNRRAFTEYVESLLVTDEPAANNHVLLIFDIDYFKKINDNFGHAAGDQVLVRMTELVQDRLRKQDELYRIGGEEFLVILHNTSIADAKHLSEVLRKLVASSDLLANQTVTISIGLSKYNGQNESADTWFNRADTALYQAKANGRNQVCII